MKPSLHNDWRDKLPMLLLMLGPVLYLAAVLASGYEDGINIIELMGRFAEMVERPFSLRWTGHTLKFMLGAVIAYGVTVLFLFSTKENKRTGEEHGSARWGSARQLDRKYRDKDPERNTVLTQHVSMSLDGRKHRRNLLQIVVGGSGSGKTRFFAKPNLMEANCSYSNYAEASTQSCVSAPYFIAIDIFLKEKLFLSCIDFFAFLCYLIATERVSPMNS